jgi:hypothetical protein
MIKKDLTIYDYQIISNKVLSNKKITQQEFAFLLFVQKIVMLNVYKRISVLFKKYEPKN